MRRDGGHVAQHHGEWLLTQRLARAPQGDGPRAEALLEPLREVVHAGEEFAAGAERPPVLMRVHGGHRRAQAPVGTQIAALTAALHRLARFGLGAEMAVARERVGAHRVRAVHLVAVRPPRRGVEHEVDENDAPVVDDVSGILARIAFRARKGLVTEPPLLDVVEARQHDANQPMLRRDHGLWAVPPLCRRQVLENGSNSRAPSGRGSGGCRAPSLRRFFGPPRREEEQALTPRRKRQESRQARGDTATAALSSARMKHRKG
jgi:hypothetical protein